MNFRVVWPDAVTRRLSRIYRMLHRRGIDSTRFNLAIERVDRGLALDPLSFGESRAGNARLWFERPAEVYYEVHEKIDVVVVLAVRFLHNR